MTFCSMCRKEGLHAVSDNNSEKKAYFCCYHYEKLFCQSEQRCAHHQYREITCIGAKYGKYDVHLTLVYRPQEESVQIWRAVVDILRESSAKKEKSGSDAV